MPDQIMMDILDHCLYLDDKAGKVYSKFSSLAQKPALKDFWRAMSEDEQKHRAYWQQLKDLAEQDLLPEVFEQPYKIRGELALIRAKIDAICSECSSAKSAAEMFMLAYRLEFLLIHPAIIGLLNFLETLPAGESPNAAYNSHLQKFISGLSEHGREKPELELLAETISRLWRDNRTLALMSNIDPLTGILNRRGVFDALIPLIYLAQRKKLNVGIMILDIDSFKEVNDKYGHLEGDRILIWLANLLKSSLRASDVIGRYGGEEFLIYLSDVERGHLFDVAEKLRRQVETESREKIPIKVSIGVFGGVLDKDLEADLQSLIKKADENLLAAKKAGKNKVSVGG